MTNPADANPATDEQLHELIAEYHERLDKGETIDPESFCAEHTDHADQLRRYFDNVAKVENLAGPRADGQKDAEGTYVTSETAAAGYDETIVEQSASQTANARVASDAPPTQFGRYRILSELGRGAMGAVYLAQDEQLDRKVALKIPQFGGGMNKGLLERFYREARAAGNLRHNGICPVYDVGEIEGQHYITMAYIEGRPLRDFSKSSKRQTGKQTARVIRKIAMAMAEAHEQNVIHRDLKPANVMIDKKNEPVVMDFGLARRTAENEEKLTHTGTVIGTPAYMSPEQVDGDNENVGPKSDIYSLGVMFYELLTGELPFQGNLMSILKKIALEQPRPPVEIHGDIDPTLQKLCLKMLEKDAKDRPESMQAVVKELSDWLQGKHAPTDESGVLETSRVPGQKKKKKKKKKKQDQIEATEPMTVPGEPRSEPLQEEFPAPEPEPQLSATRDFNPPKKRGLLIAAALGGIALLAGVVFYVNIGGKYDVKITVEDPTISLKIDGDDVLIDGAGSSIRLSAGTHTLRMQRDGLEAELNEFTVKKDGENLVHVAVVDGRFALMNQTPNPLARPSDQGPGDPATAPIASNDSALEFSSSKTQVNIPQTLKLDSSRPHTIEAWVRSEEVHAPVSHWYKPQPYPRLYLDNEMYFEAAGSRSAVWRTPEVSDKWFHVAGVHDENSVRLYVDGKLVGENENHPLAAGEDSLRNGLRIGGGLKPAGEQPWQIDEFRVSQTARYTADFKPLRRMETDEHTLALYHFDEGSGDIAKDSSGNGHHGKIVGAKWVAIRPDGRGSAPPGDTVSPGDADSPAVDPVVPGYALHFDGSSDDQFLATLSEQEPLSDLTLEAWVTVEIPETRSVVLEASGPRSALTTIELGGTKGWVAYRHHNGAPNDPEFRAAWPQGRTHVATVQSGDQISIFVNGRLKASTTFTKPPVRFDKLRVGVMREIGDYSRFAGILDEIRLSRKARYTTDFDPAERLEPDDQTVALYHFDEGSGDIAKDSSGNDHHGKIVGAKWVAIRPDGRGSAPPAETASPGDADPPAVDPVVAGYALHFDGSSDDQFLATLKEQEPFSDQTLEAWITHEGPRVATVALEAYGGEGVITRVEHLGREGWHAYRYHFGTHNGSPYSDGDSRDRTHVAIVQSAGKLSVFVDGKLKAAKTFQKEPVQYTGLVVGRKLGNHRFVGVMDEIRFSRVARYTADFDPAERLETDDQTVALYHFDEGSGDIAKDSSGNGYHAKLKGVKWVRVADTSASTLTTAGRETTGALRFAHGDEVNFPTLTDNGEPFTIELDLIKTGLHGNYGNVFGFVGKKQTEDPQLQFKGNSLSAFAAVVPRVTTKGVPVENNQRTQVAVVRDQEELRIYINGKLGSSVSIAGLEWIKGGHLRLGRYIGTLIGDIYQLRVSNGARYTQDYAPPRRFTNDDATRALYHFDEGQGDVLKDSSGNDHHGKITGAKWVRSDPPQSSRLELWRIVDPERDKVSGGPCRVEGDTIVFDHAFQDEVRLAVHPTGSYRFETVVTKTGRNVDFYLPVGGRFFLAHWNGSGSIHHRRFGDNEDEKIAGGLSFDSPRQFIFDVRFDRAEYEVTLTSEGRVYFTRAGRRAALMSARTTTPGFVLHHGGTAARFQAPTLFMREGEARLLHPEDASKLQNGVAHRAGPVEPPIGDTESDGVRWPLEPSRPEDIAWLLNENAILILRTGPDREIRLTSKSEPPAGPATIVGVEYLRFEDDATAFSSEESLRRLATLGDLESLKIAISTSSHNVPPRDALKHLTALTNLRYLLLGSFFPDGFDGKFLGALQKLEVLELSNARDIPWGDSIAHLPRLREIILHKSTHDQLELLGRPPQLRSLILSGFAARRAEREEAAQRFAKQVPWCRITIRDDRAGDNEAFIEPSSPMPSLSDRAGHDAIAPFDEAG